MEKENLFEIVSYNEFDALLEGKQFSNYKSTVEKLNTLEFKDKKTHSLLDLKTGELIDINTPADKEKIISDFWAKELSHSTDLSAGMTSTKIDERQSHHYRNFEYEKNKPRLERNPIPENGTNNINFQVTASAVAELLKDGKNILVLDAKVPNRSSSSTEIDSVETLIKNLKQNFFPEGSNKSISLRLYGDHKTPPIFQTTFSTIKDEFISELNKLQQGKNENVELFGGKIRDLALEASRNPKSLEQYDIQTQNTIKLFINSNIPEMEKNLPLVLDEIKISQEQSKAISEYFEYGTGSPIPLSDEQLSKIPDIIEGKRITNFEKLELATGSLEFSNYGTEYSIENNSIVKTQLNDNLIPEKSILNVSDVSFDNKQRVQYLKDQLKYLGFGENENLHKDLLGKLDAPEKEFHLKITSDKTLPGNKVDFTLNYAKSEKGGVFLNSYDATFVNAKEELNQNFRVSKENTFTAKEAINLLEGRSVKVFFENPKTNTTEPAFVKLALNEEKNQQGNFNYQTYYQNYGVDTKQIVEKSNLVFNKPEYLDSTIKSLEKGNIVKVQIKTEDSVIDAKAVLNPQYKNLSLYDNDMNRLNTNKALQGIDNAEDVKKNNAREHSISRGI